MVDRQYRSARTAVLYDPLCGRDERDDFAFSLPLVMSADSVLDVGCGTGSLLRSAREAGHRGRLVGLDPAAAMLAVARERADVEWTLGDLSATSYGGEFDLVVMTGHAFQVFISDDELRQSLRAIRGALEDAGRFAFETRNPLVREWEQWANGYGVTFVDVDGMPARFTADVEFPVNDDVVRFISSYQRADWTEPECSHSTLRFLDVDAVDRFLGEEGFAIAERYGNWDLTPFDATSLEIITIASPSFRLGE